MMSMQVTTYKGQLKARAELMLRDEAARLGPKGFPK